MADVTVSCFCFFIVGGAAEAATVTAVVQSLAVSVHADRALRALEDRIAHLCEVAEAGRAGRLQVILGTLVELGLAPSHVLTKGSHLLDPHKLAFSKVVHLVTLHTFVVVKEVDGLLRTGFLQVFDEQLSFVLI